MYGPVEALPVEPMDEVVIDVGSGTDEEAGADSGVKAVVDFGKADSGVKAEVLISKKEEEEEEPSWSMSPHWVVGGGGSLGEVDGAEQVENGDLSSTESSLEASGDVVGAQVNALHEYHWVKHPLGSDEDKSPVAEVEGFIHYRVRGGCK